MTYARRVDVNHGEITRAFRKLGCVVFDSSRLGNGGPDLIVQLGGVTMLVECKAEKGKLTKAQSESDLMCRLVRDMDGVAGTVATLRRWHEVIAKASVVEVIDALPTRLIGPQ